MRWVFWFFFFKQKTAYEMRISDWSSDVCSSDLLADYQTPTGRPARRLLDAQGAAASAAEDARAAQAELEQFDSLLERLEAKRNEQRRLIAELDDHEQQRKPPQQDRKSAVEGKRVSGRVDLGGRSIIQKKNK